MKYILNSMTYVYVVLLWKWGLTKEKDPFVDSLLNSEEWEAIREIIATFRKRGSTFPIRTFFEQQ